MIHKSIIVGFSFFERRKRRWRRRTEKNKER
jgi:hypothetical protein